MRGKVSWVDSVRNFGFIECDDSMFDDHFFHKSGCNSPFINYLEGSKVEFTSHRTAKGMRAEGVSLIGED